AAKDFIPQTEVFPPESEVQRHLDGDAQLGDQDARTISYEREEGKELTEGEEATVIAGEEETTELVHANTESNAFHSNLLRNASDCRQSRDVAYLNLLKADDLFVDAGA
ncbi:hypothetical protein LTR16_012291, partial [Cryomyces antarcticus]